MKLASKPNSTISSCKKNIGMLFLMDTIHSSHSWLVYHYGKAVLWNNSFGFAVIDYFFVLWTWLQIAGTWDEEIAKWKQLYCGVEFSLLPAVRFLPLPKWTQWGGPAPQMLISHVLFLMFYPPMIKFLFTIHHYHQRIIWAGFYDPHSTGLHRLVPKYISYKVKVHWGYFPFLSL